MYYDQFNGFCDHRLKAVITNLFPGWSMLKFTNVLLHLPAIALCGIASGHN
jgi:hypothetical protein